MINLPEISDPTAANPDGTPSWQAIKDSGFWYYDRRQGSQPLFGFIDDVVEPVTELA